MANYTINVLRNNTVFDNKEKAIEALNTFEHHYYGQPLALLYKGSNGSTQLLFAVGIKNSDEQTTIKCGPSFYEIINSEQKAILNWNIFNSGIIESQDQFKVVKLSKQDFESMLDEWETQWSDFNDHVFFVECMDEYGKKYGLIYKGKVCYSSYSDNLHKWDSFGF